jgi:ATP-dependent DNA helicase RecG
MSQEGQTYDRKSIRYALGKQADHDGLAADCVGLANARGGIIHVGVEDGADSPPPGQRVRADLPDQLRKRMAQLTVNVGMDSRLVTDANGGQYVELQVFPTLQGVASTTSGVYYIRVADETQRLLPDELGRLWIDRASMAWELQTGMRVKADLTDPDKLAAFARMIRASDRVSDFVKRKAEPTLLEHYQMVKDGFLTNLGVLWVGRTADRAALQHGPVLQCIRYDERGQKARKWTWDDYTRTPMELIEAVWNEVPDWKDSFELPDGLFRKQVPHYEEGVVRELLANALVHRPYTTGGDIFLNLYPDRLEVHNPGRLPTGVTPRNILHASNPRNPHLARVFFDLKLMEREGSGFDRMYRDQLVSGRPIPEVREGDDRVVVVVKKRILNPEIIDLMVKVDQTHAPTQRELITLGLLAQHEAMRASELAEALELPGGGSLDEWLGRLRTWGVVSSRGRTKATEYYVTWDILRQSGYQGPTSLKGIEPHRLRELVLQDLAMYREASRSQIHARIGLEIPLSKVRRALQDLVRAGSIGKVGEKRGRRYVLSNRAPNAPG